MKVLEVSPWAKVRVPEAPVKSSAEAVSPEPMEVAKSTVCAACASPVRVTVKVSTPPSVTEAFATEKTGAASSLTMVPLAAPAEGLTVAPAVALVRLTVSVSSASSSASCVVCTVKVLEVSPWAKVRVPEVPVKSPAEAVSSEPMEVAKSTVCAACASPVRVTVKVSTPPSVTEAFATEKTGAASSLTMVPLAEPAEGLTVAPAVALDRLTVSVSSASSSASCVVWTVKVLEVSPWAKVMVPAAPVKSSAEAVSPEPMDVA